MADDGLDEEERELLKKHRDSKRKAQEDEREVWIRQGDHEAAVPYSKALPWLREKFGIDLADEPVQEQPDAAPGQQESGQQGGDVRRFAGRRMA